MRSENAGVVLALLLWESRALPFSRLCLPCHVCRVCRVCHVCRVCRVCHVCRVCRVCHVGRVCRVCVSAGQGSTLCYYSDPASRVFRKQLRLEGATMTVATRKPMLARVQYHLRLSHPSWDRPLKAYVMTEAEQRDWVALLITAGVTQLHDAAGADVDSD
jgi:hypothetical protein